MAVSISEVPVDFRTVLTLYKRGKLTAPAERNIDRFDAQVAERRDNVFRRHIIEMALSQQMVDF